MKRITLLLSIFILCLAMLSPCASAAEGRQLEILFAHNGELISDAEFSLYYLGSVSGKTVVPASEFSSYKVSFDISDSENNAILAETIWAYVLRDDIIADYTDRTDTEGKADFGGVILEDGAYLVAAGKHYSNGMYYFFKPTIIVIPYTSADKLIIAPKFETVPEETKDINVSYRVLKAWTKDTGGIRPVEIQVQLLCDGEIYDTVTLSADNEWRYTWRNLSVHNHWTVTEKYVAGDYVVSLTSQEMAFLLTNAGSAEPDEESTAPEEPTSDVPGTSPDNTTLPDEIVTDSEYTTTESGNTTPDKEDELPVTGALKWPIPYLALLGVLIFIIGYVKYRKSEINYEQG